MLHLLFQSVPVALLPQHHTESAPPHELNLPIVVCFLLTKAKQDNLHLFRKSPREQR